MKKIGILTACRTDNNGTDLQCLAMFLLIRKLTKSVEVIDYRCPELEKSRTIFSFKSFSSFLNIPFRLYDHLKRNAFRKKNILYSQEVFTQKNIAENTYQSIIVGSDQLWNFSVTGKDSVFFLPYKKSNQFKYSYAVSFGTQNITELNLNYLDYLRNFSCVSVREKTSAVYLNKLGIKARFDLDPLLMIPSYVWETYVGQLRSKTKYILVYTTGYDLTAINLARKYAKEKKTCIICVGGTIRPIYNVQIVRFCSLNLWLAYIKNAEVIVTDSYHCLSFAINFHKRFVISNKNLNKNDFRIIDLLRLIGIGNQFLNNLCECDWKSVDKIIEDNRKRSFDYLKDIVGE